MRTAASSMLAMMRPVADSVFPQGAELRAPERLAQAARIVERREPVVEEAQDAGGDLTI